MLHRRPVSAATSSSAGPSAPHAPQGPVNTAYTPLRRRESANLYPSPASATKARYPLPSPGMGSFSSPSTAGPNALGLASPIGNGGQAGYGYGGPGGSGQYGDGNTFDLGEGQRRTAESGDLQTRTLAMIRNGIDRGQRGVVDAMRLDRSWNLAYNDAELRLLIFKSSIINLLSLLLLSFFSIVVSPSLGPALSDSKITRDIGMWYKLLLSWPVFAVCFWVNLGSCYLPTSPDFASSFRADPYSYRHQPSPASTPLKSSNSLPSLPGIPDASSIISPLFKGVARIMLIADFTLMSRLISLVPFVGRLLGFGYMSIITGYYCFEWNFASRGWSLDHRVSYVQERAAYMVGFGLLPTFLTSLFSPLVNMSIFALLYPFFVIQALVSRPPGLSASSITSPGSSLPPTPTESASGNNPFFSERHGRTSWKARVLSGGVPLFVLARYGLEILGWFEVAIGRKLGGSMRVEKPGKRLG